MSAELDALRAALREHLANQCEAMRRRAEQARHLHAVLAEALARADAGALDVLRVVALECRLPEPAAWYWENPAALALRYGVAASEAEAAARFGLPAEPPEGGLSCPPPEEQRRRMFAFKENALPVPMPDPPPSPGGAAP